MSHERECGACLHCGEPCICSELRAAYRRGREDAAHAACDHIYGPNPMADKARLTYVRLRDLNGLFAAARGEDN